MFSLLACIYQRLSYSGSWMLSLWETMDRTHIVLAIFRGDRESALFESKRGTYTVDCTLPEGLMSVSALPENTFGRA